MQSEIATNVQKATVNDKFFSAQVGMGIINYHQINFV
jgi:hypothetical protein